MSNLWSQYDDYLRLLGEHSRILTDGHESAAQSFTRRKNAIDFVSGLLAVIVGGEFIGTLFSNNPYIVGSIGIGTAVVQFITNYANTCLKYEELASKHTHAGKLSRRLMIRLAELNRTDHTHRSLDIVAELRRIRDEYGEIFDFADVPAAIREQTNNIYRLVNIMPTINDMGKRRSIRRRPMTPDPPAIVMDDVPAGGAVSDDDPISSPVKEYRIRGRRHRRRIVITAAAQSATPIKKHRDAGYHSAELS